MGIRVFVNGHELWLNKLREALHLQLQTLGLPDNSVPVYDYDSADLPPRSVVLYFSDAPHTVPAGEMASLTAHIDRADNDPNRIVIPVLDTLRDVRRKLPEILHRFNAFELGDPPNHHSLVHEILDRIWHARLERRMFISYRRLDSAGIAHQLRNELQEHGYEVFLDESSIRPGADFQRELMAWLNDSDFVLLLASPGLENSKWVQHEIAFANTSYIGILALCWPPALGGPSRVTDSLFADQKHSLRNGDISNDPDPENRKLTSRAVNEILSKIDRFRAAAILQRLKNLIPLVTKDHETNHRSEGSRFGDISFTHTRSGSRIYVRVLPFRPSICTMHTLSRDLAGQALDRAGCFYIENDIRSPAVEAHQWVLAGYRARPGEPDYRIFPYTGEPIKWAG